MRKVTVATCVPVLFVLLLSGKTVAQASRIQVGPNVHVSADDKVHIQTEGLVAASPKGSDLLGCTMTLNEESMGSGDWGVVAYHSADSGAHWQATFRSNLDENAADPACAYGPDGTAYQIFFPTRFASDEPHLMHLYRSQDGGDHWSQGGAMRVADREYVTVDLGSRNYAGRVYVHGTGRTDPIEANGSGQLNLSLWHSEDGGRSFLGPITRTAAEHHAVYGMGNSVVLSDGTWLAVFGETEPDHPAWLQAVRSVDGGRRLEDPVRIESWNIPTAVNRSSVVPCVSVDATSGPFKDRVYVVWPNADGNVSEIRFSFSADGGKTWSKSIVLNDRPAVTGVRLLADAFMPMIAVNSIGVVGVAWYDRSESPDGLGWHVRFTSSLDGGETWLPSVRVSEKPAEFGTTIQPPLSRLPRGWEESLMEAKTPEPAKVGDPISVGLTYDTFPYTGGHTSGMAADRGGTFHPYWVDNRTGTYQVWTAPVRVVGAVSQNGDPSLSVLTDVTDAVAVTSFDPAYDPVTQTGKLTIALRNTSKNNLLGPIKLRLLHVESDVAIITMQNADNGIGGGGAIWDLTTKTPPTGLSPGAPPVLQDLTFQASSVRPFQRGPGFDDFKFLLAHLTMRVYAQRKPLPEAHLKP